MYEQHFGLERRVFRGNASGSDVFVGPQTAQVMSGIKKALSGPDAVVTVSGPVGSGKSTAVAHALCAVSGKNAVVRIGRIPLQRGEVLDLLFDHMRIKQRPSRSNQKLTLFRQLLFNLAANSSRMFILVEDAPFTGADVLADLEVLTAADTGPSDGANVILMGDETLRALTTDPALARLRQRIRLRRTVEPATAEELGGYLRHCFRRAGGDFDKILPGGAADLLHELSGGILRVANNLVESSMDAAADLAMGKVDADLIIRVANEEFGLSGTFARPPVIEDEESVPELTDDATAQLVALNLPDSVLTESEAPEPVEVADTADAPDGLDAPKPTDTPAGVEPEPETLALEPMPEAAVVAENIPDLIQDTQPELTILPEPPVVTDEDDEVPELIQDTQPKLAALAPDRAADNGRRRTSEPKPVQPEVHDDKDIPTLSAALEETVPEPEPIEPKAQLQPEPDKPKAQQQPEPVNTKLERKLVAPKPSRPATPPAKPEPKPEARVAAKPPVNKVEPETAPPAAEVPAWERDPTLAEMRPDLEALERAMAIAHGRDPDAGEPVEETPPPEVDKKDATLAGVPEITLDDSINRKVEIAALELQERLDKESGGAEKPEDPAETAESEEKKDRKADAELEKIAAGLAKAKTIEDVDDRMAETLFGEEISLAAAEIQATMKSAESANDDTESPAPDVADQPGTGNEDTAGGKSSMEQEFENVWGTTGEEVDIDAGGEKRKGGLDLSASQRLATVRALNTGESSPAATPAAGSTTPSDTPAEEPQPIEEQITTSMTQTLKALNARQTQVAQNDDDDDDDDEDGKSGFFSRFKRT